MVENGFDEELIKKLPDELRTKYESHACRRSPVVEQLKIGAALKLWERGQRNIWFEQPLKCADKKLVYVKVFTHDEERVIAVECASEVKLGWLRGRVEQLRMQVLPQDSWLILVFPSSVGDHARKAAKLANEVWLIGENGAVEQIMFVTYLRKETRRPRSRGNNQRQQPA